MGRPRLQHSLGFPFPIGNATYTTLYIPSYGEGEFLSTKAEDQGLRTEINPMIADLIDQGTSVSESPISYKLTGSAGNHILKIEWKNAGFWGGATSDFISFQVWLYEQDGKMAFHYGPHSIQNPSSVFQGAGPFVAVFVAYNPENGDFGHLLFLGGNPTHPDFTEIDPGDTPPNMPPQLNGVPPEGAVYTFTDGSLGVKNYRKTAVTIFPNPTSSRLYLQTKMNDYRVEIRNVLGQKVRKWTQRSPKILDVSNLATGIYFLHISASHQEWIKRFVKN